MKTFKYLLPAAAALFIFTGCQDWLDVSPKTQVKAKDMFKTETGFRDALYGVYTAMGVTEAYGGNETFITLDLFAQTYTTVTDTYNTYVNHQYMEKGPRSAIDLMWSNNYNAIANCNNILDHIDKVDRSIFGEGAYEMVKAEVMALRAFLHFDMLRAFGPVPTPANLDKPAIPVITRLTHIPQDQSTIREVVDFVISELKEARALIAPYDPIGPAFDEYVEERYYENNPVDFEHYYKDDGFWMYRRSRFNYYGMTALMARASLWGGRTAEALGYAQEVIEAEKFPLMTEDVYNGTNTVAFMSQNEYITSIYRHNMQKNIHDVYFNPTSSNGTALSAQFYFNDIGLTAIFGADRDLDWRFKKLIGANGINQQVILKYTQGHRIPLLKIAEMYYIAAEVSGDISYINDFRDHRGFVNSPLASDADMSVVLMNEYRREFIAEGQFFYYCKRLDKPAFPNNKTAGAAVYRLPFPDDEIEFGNIKQD